MNLKEQIQRRIEGITNKKRKAEGQQEITEERERIQGEDFYNYGVRIKEAYYMMRDNWYAAKGKKTECQICKQALSLTRYCEHWEGEKMTKEEIKWIKRCRQEKKLYMIGINQEITEKMLKKGRKIKNRLMKFAQWRKKQIEETKWEKDWNEEEETKQIRKAMAEYEIEYEKVQREVEKRDIKAKNYKDRIESKWQCLRRGALVQDGKREYDREFYRLKRRVDRINQSVLTIKKIELHRARIRYKVKEEEIKRAETQTSRKP